MWFLDVYQYIIDRMLTMKLLNHGFPSGYVEVIMSVLYPYQMMFVLFNNNTTGGTSGAGIAYPFASPDFFPVLLGLFLLIH